mmetsp:Transcript_71837/g.150077  ORF Transcript_71837/g.150077 Transcript_71837/m.150077 type:complete len:203 (+) Transcript_71837:97-705(+)
MRRKKNSPLASTPPSAPSSLPPSSHVTLHVDHAHRPSGLRDGGHAVTRRWSRGHEDTHALYMLQATRAAGEVTCAPSPSHAQGQSGDAFDPVCARTGGDAALDPEIKTTRRSTQPGDRNPEIRNPEIRELEIDATLYLCGGWVLAVDSLTELALVALLLLKLQLVRLGSLVVLGGKTVAVSTVARVGLEHASGRRLRELHSL